MRMCCCLQGVGIRYFRIDGVACFFNDTATTEIYSLSLHDALPISAARRLPGSSAARGRAARATHGHTPVYLDRKSTRLNSSHANISYAVFCLKKKKGCNTTF